MKKNLISAIAGWKSAALLALVAMVATVAFSGVLTSTPQAEAQDPDATIQQGAASAKVSLTAEVAGTPPSLTTSDTIGGTPATAVPDEGEEVGSETAYTVTIDFTDAERVAMALGDHTYAATGATVTEVTVKVIPVQAVPGQTVRVRVTQTGDGGNVYRISGDSTATGSFVANPGRTFVICADDATTAADELGCDVDDSDTNTEDNVRANVPGQVTLLVRVAADSPKGMIFITRGADVTTERAIQVSPAPVATGLKVSGALPGPVGLSQSAEGPGETITVTVTNNRGAPVSGQRVTLTTTQGQFSGCGAVEVALPVCNLTTGADGTDTATLRGDNRAGSATITATAGSLTRTLAVTFFGLADGLSASAAGGVATVDQGGTGFVILTVTDKDGNAVKDANPGASATTELENPVVVTLDNTVEYEGSPSPLDNVQACSGGTNVAGQCAVQVSAAANASRGVHTVAASMVVQTPAGPKVLADTIDIRVVGAPHSLETDAPASVEPRTTVKVNISVFDDEGELVGGGSVTVVKLEGRGAVLGTADDKATLVGGKTSFEYYATSTDTSAVFRLTAGAGPGAVTEIIEIVVAEAAVEAEPEPDPGPPATWNNELVSGQNLVVWNGEDGADPSAGAAEGVTAIWSYNTGSGSWDGYFPGAADVPGGNTLTSLSNGQAYVVIVE